MKKSLYTPPDEFSMSPLISLLPVRGQIRRLSSLTSSLYARYEKVIALEKELAQDADGEMRRRLADEEAMLKQVLDWIASQPGE